MADEPQQRHSELASFGEELRREREIRGISLKEISDATPESGVDGKDLQLDKAIEWTLDQLKKNPVNRPTRPAYKKQTAGADAAASGSGR